MHEFIKKVISHKIILFSFSSLQPLPIKIIIDDNRQLMRNTHQLAVF